MSTFGLTATGFVPKRLADIKAEKEELFRGIFGADIDVSAESVFGQLIGALSKPEADVWEQMEAVYGAAYPKSAESVQLDDAAELTGATRLPATKSTVTAQLLGSVGTVVPAGTQLSVAVEGDIFVTLADVTLLVTATPVACESVATGAILAPEGSLTSIETPVSGLTSCTNTTAAVPGRDIETDAAFRTRREASLLVSGSGTVEAIRARLRQFVAGVTDAYVFANDTDLVDADGREPHSIECVVDGGAAADIAAAIWASGAGGIRTHGNLSEVIVDSQGNNQTIKYSRSVSKFAWVEVILTLNTEEEFPSNGADQVKQAILDYGNTMGIGDNFILQRLYGPIYSIPGIASASVEIAVTDTEEGVPVYGSANIPIAATDKAVWDLTRITVV